MLHSGIHCCRLTLSNSPACLPANAADESQIQVCINRFIAVDPDLQPIEGSSCDPSEDPKLHKRYPDATSAAQANTGDGMTLFQSSKQLQRTALLFNGNQIWVGFGSHCDQVRTPNFLTRVMSANYIWAANRLRNPARPRSPIVDGMPSALVLSTNAQMKALYALLAASIVWAAC